MLLLLFDADFSVLDVELVLDAGDERFCEAVEEVVVCLPAGDVLTDKGEVNPEVLVMVTLLLLLACAVDRGGVLRVGAPEVLRS